MRRASIISRCRTKRLQIKRASPDRLSVLRVRWCSGLLMSSMSRCLRPDSRACIIPGAEPQITMPAGIATARSGVLVTSWYM